MLYRSLAVALFASVALANPVPETPTDACSIMKCKAGTTCEVDGNGDGHCAPNEGEKCGNTLCGKGEECCNDSCSICVPVGGMCTAQICTSEPEPVKCGSNTCDGGEVCCNESCGICAPPDGVCTLQACLPEEDHGDHQGRDVEEPALGGQCGPNTCASDETCCNESCGTCTKPGESCTEQFCLPDDEDDAEEPPLGGQCGPNTCGDDETCCNESCGICTKPGEMCTEQFCVPEEGEDDEDDAEGPTPGGQCGSNTCGDDEWCCNESCGICAALSGGGCTKQLCPSED